MKVITYIILPSTYAFQDVIILNRIFTKNSVTFLCPIKFVDIEETTDPGVKTALENIGLEKYIQHFHDAEIDYETFMSINEAHLLEMKIPIGPRIKILQEVERLKNDSETSGRDLFNLSLCRL